MSRKRVAILGSTGSIGEQTLQVAATLPDHLEIVALAAYGNAERLAEQARDWGVTEVALVDAAAAVRAQSLLPDGRVRTGAAGLTELIAECGADVVVGAISGGAGLVPLVEALAAGVDVALANKEPLVMAGGVVTDLAARSGARLLPVDSELSAIFQCLQGQPRETVTRVLLTASGGPFSRLSADELQRVTPQQALAHPTWRMGRKVTVDSATLANKGFEIYEVHWLFGVPFAAIEVVVHHQSIIHSLVEFADTSVLAQLGCPDMRVPIQYALLYPARVANDLPRLDLAALGSLTFATPDTERFPCLRLARMAAEAGGTYPAALNGADEAAVELFLEGRLGFMAIPEMVDRALQAHQGGIVGNVEDALRADDWAREYVRSVVTGKQHS